MEFAYLFVVYALVEPARLALARMGNKGAKRLPTYASFALRRRRWVCTVITRSRGRTCYAWTSRSTPRPSRSSGRSVCWDSSPPGRSRAGRRPGRWEGSRAARGRAREDEPSDPRAREAEHRPSASEEGSDRERRTDDGGERRARDETRSESNIRTRTAAARGVYTLNIPRCEAVARGEWTMVRSVARARGTRSSTLFSFGFQSTAARASVHLPDGTGECSADRRRMRLLSLDTFPLSLSLLLLGVTRGSCTPAGCSYPARGTRAR